MSNLKAKLKKQEGFTLIEMLIVVAIIAILVAVSIPLINNALDRAKHATDAANERSAKAEILIQYMSDGGMEITPDTAYWYDAAKGSLVKKADSATRPTDYGKHKDHGIIKVQVSNTGEVTVSWLMNGKTGNDDTAATGGLCGNSAVGH